MVYKTGAEGDKCYACTWNGADTDAEVCETPSDVAGSETNTEVATVTNPYCYTSVDGKFKMLRL